MFITVSFNISQLPRNQKWYPRKLGMSTVSILWTFLVLQQEVPWILYRGCVLCYSECSRYCRIRCCWTITSQFHVTTSSLLYPYCSFRSNRMTLYSIFFFPSCPSSRPTWLTRTSIKVTLDTVPVPVNASHLKFHARHCGGRRTVCSLASISLVRTVMQRSSSYRIRLPRTLCQPVFGTRQRIWASCIATHTLWAAKEQGREAFLLEASTTATRYLSNYSGDTGHRVRDHRHSWLRMSIFVIIRCTRLLHG